MASHASFGHRNPDSVMKAQDLISCIKSDQIKRQKHGVRQLILTMSSGENQNPFYDTVISLIDTSDIELKKLVCLYIVTHSQGRDEKTMFIINTLIQDAISKDPLTRALAIKTIGGIRSEKIITHFLGTVMERVKMDDDPYVRKCAVLCVAKFYATAPSLVEGSELIKETINCLKHQNAMVISNSIIALTEISRMAGRSVFPKVDSKMLRTLCTSMLETTEWGQISILEYFSTLENITYEDAETIIQDISKCLKHTNSAVVLAAVKVYVLFTLRFDAVRDKHLKDIVNPLIGLVHSGPEVLYPILRNISLIVQEFPDLMKKDVMSFTASINEPHCVRMEKIDIMTRLVDETNIENVLIELVTYSQEADNDIVKKAIYSIGKCALKVPTKVEECVLSIEGFMDKDLPNAIEVSIVVMKDIFRQYKNQFLSVLNKFSEHVDEIQESEARAAFVWLLGEYPDKFECLSEDFQNHFVREFLSEPYEVQLQILTAAVKIYLFSPTTSKEMLERLMNTINDSCQNPDLRDRSFMYRRLVFSAHPSIVMEIICSEKPKLDCQTDGLDRKLRRELLKHMCTLASVYHKSPHTFIDEINSSTILDENIQKDFSNDMDLDMQKDAQYMNQEEDFNFGQSENIQGGEYFNRIEFNNEDYSQLSSCIPSGNLDSFSQLGIGGNNHFNSFSTGFGTPQGTSVSGFSNPQTSSTNNPFPSGSTSGFGQAPLDSFSMGGIMNSSSNAQNVSPWSDSSSAFSYQPLTASPIINSIPASSQQGFGMDGFSSNLGSSDNSFFSQPAPMNTQTNSMGFSNTNFGASTAFPTSNFTSSFDTSSTSNSAFGSQSNTGFQSFGGFGSGAPTMTGGGTSNFSSFPTQNFGIGEKLPQTNFTNSMPPITSQMKPQLSFAADKFLNVPPNQREFQNLSQSPDLILMKMRSAGFIQMSALTESKVTFGASFVNGDDVYIEVKFGGFSPTTCFIFSHKPAIIGEISNLIASL